MAINWGFKVNVKYVNTTGWLLTTNQVRGWTIKFWETFLKILKIYYFELEADVI